MPEITVKSAKNIIEYLKIVESFTAGLDSPLWYRGIGSVKFKLLPSLYRHEHTSQPSKIINLEIDLFSRFRDRASLFMAKPASPAWEQLFIMQHYGIPTRLLDWSESPFIALFFAVSSGLKNPGSQDYQDDAAVWVFSPSLWNKGAFSDVSRENSGPLTGDDPLLKRYDPLTRRQDTPPGKNIPAAMLAIHNNQRIIAQRGVFTIFGTDTTPMEDIYTSNDSFRGMGNVLYKIIIPKKHINTIASKLMVLGFSDSAVFPDLEGLSKETKRYFSF